VLHNFKVSSSRYLKPLGLERSCGGVSSSTPPKNESVPVIRY